MKQARNHQIKLATLLMKANGTQEVAAEAVSKKEYTAMVTDLQVELRGMGFKTQYRPPTKEFEGEIILFKNNSFELSLVVLENLRLIVQLTDQKTDKVKESRMFRTLKNSLPDIKAYMRIVAKDLKQSKLAPGIKTVEDKTTRNQKVAKKEARKSGKKIITVPDFKDSATKARNWIKKTVGGDLVKASRYGDTSYNDWQTLEIDLTGPQVEKLQGILQGSGLLPTKSQFNRGQLIYKQGNLDLLINKRPFTLSTGRNKGKVLYNVKCSGVKKSKRSSLPLYD